MLFSPAACTACFVSPCMNYISPSFCMFTACRNTALCSGAGCVSSGFLVCVLSLARCLRDGDVALTRRQMLLCVCVTLCCLYSVFAGQWDPSLGMEPAPVDCGCTVGRICDSTAAVGQHKSQAWHCCWYGCAVLFWLHGRAAQGLLFVWTACRSCHLVAF